MTVDIQDLVYTAGLIDGEGSIVIGVSKPSTKRGNKLPSHWLQVGIINTDKELIDWLKNTFGGHISNNSHCPSRKRQRPCWAWRVVGNKAKIFLEMIYPYLRVKKKQAELAIEFQKNVINIRHASPQVKLNEIARRNWYKSEISKLTLGNHTL